jgi:hypothetical protein
MKYAVVFFLCYIYSNSFSANDTIEIRNTFFGKHYYYYNVRQKSVKDLEPLLCHNPESNLELKKAKAYDKAGIVLGTIGGVCVGIPLGTVIAGGKPIWELLGVGAGFIAICIPFEIVAFNHISNSVKIYNSKGPVSLDWDLNTFSLIGTF